MQTFKKVRAHLNPSLEIEGLLRTMYDPRNTLAQNVAAELERHFGEKVYRTLIPRNVRLAEAPSFGKPILLYDVQSVGAKSYLAVAQELLRRVESPTVTIEQPATPVAEPDTEVEPAHLSDSSPLEDAPVPHEDAPVPLPEVTTHD